LLEKTIAKRDLLEWRDALRDFPGQWAVVQDTLQAAADPQSQANGYIQETSTAAGVGFRLVAVPIQHDDAPAPIRRAPEFNEHCEAILSEIGLGIDEVLDLKVRGVVA
jgi:crotonobetainyl-CoA:carnitine CoA-transferase CaiB-like acyl-CoA transferase